VTEELLEHRVSWQTIISWLLRPVSCLGGFSAAWHGLITEDYCLPPNAPPNLEAASPAVALAKAASI
jgi:hypothetical protein